MQWSDVTKAPPPKMLRQFAGLFLLVFGSLAAWRAWNGQVDGWTLAIGAAAVIIGGVGLVVPALVRPVYTGWMIVAFPIGWTVSHVALALMFFVLFAPIGIAFRLFGRDALRLRPRRQGRQESFWVAKTRATSGEEYLRQF